jgi:GT2 family glycosyltransferase
MRPGDQPAVALSDRTADATSFPLVSVVIVTWNGRRYLDACLTAVNAQRGVRVETILVDNNSTDGTADYVRTAFPAVRVVALAENRGFAGGNNAGVAAATGQYVALLNNDTVAQDGCIRALLDGLDEPAGFALATARIVYMHDPGIIDSAGDGMLRAGGAFKRFHGRPVALAADSVEVFGVCGAACLMPTRVFNELGGFDETFFFSHEDVDLSYRARLLGYRCRFVADAVVRHHGSGSSGKASAFAVYYGQRNLEWLYVKNTPTTLLVRTLPAHALYLVAAAAYFTSIGRLGAFLSAKWAAATGLPRVLRARADVQASRRASASAIAGQMDRGWLTAKLQEKRFDRKNVEDHADT